MPLDQDALNSLRLDRDTPAPKPPRRLSPIGLAVVAVLVLVLIGLWFFGRNRGLEVETTTVAATRSGGSTAVLDASGYVVARRQATVSAKVTGKVAEIFIEEGDAVKENQLLARLDGSTLRPQLELAQRQMEAARKNLQQTQVRVAEAQRALRRASQLRTDKLISEADLDTAQSQVEALQAQLEALSSEVAVAEANVRVYQQNMKDLEVYSPFAGVVISKDAQPGEIVSPMSAGGGFTRTGIATIVDMESREIEVDVNEAYINRVKNNQRTEATLDAYQDWTIPSHVVSIVPAADRQKATVRVRIGFDELDPRILTDMGVKVRFLEDGPPQNAPARTVVELPTTAVVKEQDKSYVWRLRGSIAERVAVAVGAERSGRVEVLSGVRPGDTVVVQPVEGLREGVSVKVKS